MTGSLQAGPCAICGDINYSLSCGGPTICPKCDCGNFDAATVETQAKVIIALREQLHYLTGTCELAMKHRDVAEHALEIALADNPTGPIDSCRWIALLERAETAEAKLAAQRASPLRGREITDEMVNAAAREMWNDRDARHGGGWDTRDPREVCVIQTKATARAALMAALSSTECSPPKAWTEAKAEIDAGWPDDPGTSD